MFQLKLFLFAISVLIVTITGLPAFGKPYSDGPGWTNDDRDPDRSVYKIGIRDPQSDFDCKAQKQPGIYADVSKSCRMYHMCDFSGRRISSLCDHEPATVFNQITMKCDIPANVDCARSQEFAEASNTRLNLAVMGRPADEAQFIQNPDNSKDSDKTESMAVSVIHGQISNRQKRKVHTSNANAAVAQDATGRDLQVSGQSSKSGFRHTSEHRESSGVGSPPAFTFPPELLAGLNGSIDDDDE